MAAPDNPTSLLYTAVLLENNNTRYGGYHRGLFTRKFSILEEALIICTMCQGVKRDAAIFQGVATCRGCSYSPEKAKPARDIRDLVARLPMRCPLYSRGCKWNGTVVEGETHLLKCKDLLCICPNECQVGVTHKSIEQHSKTCEMREIACEHCGNHVIAKRLGEHLQTCTKLPLSDTKANPQVEQLTNSTHISVANEIPKNVMLQAPAVNILFPRETETIKAEIVPESYSRLERETAGLGERVSRLERKNELLTTALFTKPELMTFDTTTGRFLEGFKWSLFGIGTITKTVSRIESSSFYISHNNLKLIGQVGMFGSIGFSVTRVDGLFDDIIGTNTLSYYRCELKSADGGEPLVLSGRISQKLELNGRCQQFLFIDISVLLDQLYITEDCVTINIYFDMTH